MGSDSLALRLAWPCELLVPVVHPLFWRAFFYFYIFFRE